MNKPKLTNTEALGILFHRLKRMRMQAGLEPILEPPYKVNICASIASGEITDEQLERLYGVRRT